MSVSDADIVKNGIKSEHVEGDLGVGKDLAVGGQTIVQGDVLAKSDLTVEGFLYAKNIKSPEKGMFTSLEELKTVYPQPEAGWWAIVGMTFPADVYQVINGQWTYSGQTEGDITLQLSSIDGNTSVIKMKRYQSIAWNSNNPVLAEGEIGLILDDVERYKIGDGVTAWRDLPYRGKRVVQEVGGSEVDVISQKAVTEALVEKDNKIQAVRKDASKGITNRFDFVVPTGNITQDATTSQVGDVVYVVSQDKFAFKVGTTLYAKWSTYDFYMDEQGNPYRDKLYMLEKSLFGFHKATDGNTWEFVRLGQELSDSIEMLNSLTGGIIQCKGIVGESDTPTEDGIFLVKNQESKFVAIIRKTGNSTTDITPVHGVMYVCESIYYVYSGDEIMPLGEFLGGGGSGSGFFNITQQIPLGNGEYYNLTKAVAALANSDIPEEERTGMIITFEVAQGEWVDYRFVGRADDFLVVEAWKEYGSKGAIKKIKVTHGTETTEETPNEAGEVTIDIPTVVVDESLDVESSNAVQNAAVATKINEIQTGTVGGVEFIPSEDGEKTTMNILNQTGGVIASGEFSGGGGGGTSTASRIILTASIDKAQVKEGGNAELTYSYNHVNSEGDATGIKASITITVKRGTTTKYEKTTQNVSAGTYTLDISDYLLVGTTEVYVKAEVTTEDGTKQTKQAYTSINVISLLLTSSYDLAQTIAGGGYKNGNTIEIPFTITGSGTKNVSMYIDGSTTPVSQTISKSGTVNGSFMISASSLSAGRHTVQLVAERSGILSDSIYIDILKAGLNEPFVGIKYSDKTGEILLETHLTPTIKAAQYEQMSFNFVAYDPEGTIAKIDVYLNGQQTTTINAPRSMQTYTNRFTAQGTQTLMLKIGNTSYNLNIDISQSSLDLSEAVYGLIAKFDAAGRSNGESNPAQWESNGVNTIFENFNWKSNGWTGESLKLTNGAKATINYKPFAIDVKSTGLSIEMTIKVSNVMTRNASVISCINNGKGLYITAENASFKTGQTVDYENEDGEQVTREIKLGTNYVPDQWFKIALVIATRSEKRLMHIYVNGNRTGADIYDNAFNFAQDEPQNIVISSEEADIEVKNIRIYGRAISDDEELENRIVDASANDMLGLYEDNNILGDTGGVDIDKLRAKGKGILRIVRPNKLDDVYAENNKKTDFLSDVYFYSPFGKEYDFMLRNCYIRIQGTSSTKYPSKNIRIYFNKGSEELSFEINGEQNPFGKNKYKMHPGAIPMNLFTMKSDYSDSSMSMNTGGAKLFNDILKELGLLTPPQRHQYENGDSQLSAINVRTAIDGFPIDVFCASTVDGESEYYGQYNFNNEKSKSEALFGMTEVEGFTPSMAMTFETLNNGAKLCLFQSESDADVEANFDAGLETNYPDDVKWAGLSAEQQAKVLRLFGWIRDCVPSGATSSNIASFTSTKFKAEIEQYFDKDFLLTYYLWTDYYLAVDQRAKNMMLRTWDGDKWYITYYDGDTQMGKRNDCFLVYDYTTDRDTYDSEASKYAFEGRESWLWNLVLANLQDDLKSCAARLRAVMTNERVLAMFNVEQAGNWADRAFNKSGYLKYIQPNIQEMYGKIWPFIYALQGANTAHREFFIRNRFALLDAKYGTSNFQSDNVDMYLSRTAQDSADVVKITANEIYAFGYGTNNSPNLANTGIVQEGVVATFSITGAFTVNDPIRMYGASRMRVLDMTGAADHLKNAFDLGKCDALREINLQTETTGSTGWWLVISGCKSLRRINLKNQAQAKTGSNTSKELDLTNQSKLEFLDARGTLVESINFAQGAPLAEVHLPSSITILKLEYLSTLTQSELTIENYNNITTFIFAECPNLDWEQMLEQCANVQHIRVVGVNAEGNGAFLDKYMNIGGVDSEGNFVNTCSFVGTYRLTRYADDATFAAYQAHYPELDIYQPEYTTIKQLESVQDGTGWSNLDNKTGYEFDTPYISSGHVNKILSERYRCLGKKTAEGEVTICRLHEDDSTKYADNENAAFATDAVLTGAQGDVWVYEPHYWYKGINDFLNNAKYRLFSSNKAEPTRTESIKIEKDSIVTKEKFAIRTSNDYNTLLQAEKADDSYSYCTVAVEGYKQVRFPSCESLSYGAVFLDASGNIIKRMRATFGIGLIDGMYLFDTIPAEAKEVAFTIKSNAPFDYVLLTESEKLEAIEPDWCEHVECLCAAYEAYINNEKLWSISGVQSAASITKPNFEQMAENRGDGFQLVDWEMHKDVANLFYAKYGNSDSQGVCGYGTYSFNRVTGLTNVAGGHDTFANPDNKTEDAAYIPEGEGKRNISSPNVLKYENWHGNKSEWIKDEFNRDAVDYAMYAVMPDGSTRKVYGEKISGAKYPINMVNGRYMDVLCVKTGGSISTYYYDYQEFGRDTHRVVCRSYYSAYADGGVACARAVYDSSDASASVGSRLAFRGAIAKETSVSAYIAKAILP